MKSLKHHLAAVAAIFTLLFLPSSISLSQAALNPTLPEPLIKLGTLPPEDADGPHQYWEKRKKILPGRGRQRDRPARHPTALYPG